MNVACPGAGPGDGCPLCPKEEDENVPTLAAGALKGPGLQALRAFVTQPARHGDLGSEAAPAPLTHLSLHRFKLQMMTSYTSVCMRVSLMKTRP